MSQALLLISSSACDKRRYQTQQLHKRYRMWQVIKAGKKMEQQKLCWITHTHGIYVRVLNTTEKIVQNQAKCSTGKRTLPVAVCMPLYYCSSHTSSCTTHTTTFYS
jgi:hypothetical protein